MLAVGAFGLASAAGCGGRLVAEARECECDATQSCPEGDLCGSYRCDACECVMDHPSTLGTPCPEGYCDGAGVCFNRAKICAYACEFIPACMTSTPPGCYEFCFNDLADCSAAEFLATDACTSTLTPVCHADEWLSCITPILCLETEQDAGPLTRAESSSTSASGR